MSDLGTLTIGTDKTQILLRQMPSIVLGISLFLCSFIFIHQAYTKVIMRTTVTERLHGGDAAADEENNDDDITGVDEEAQKVVRCFTAVRPGWKSLKSRAFSHYRFTLSLGSVSIPCSVFLTIRWMVSLSFLLLFMFICLFFLENKKGHEQHMTLVKHLKPDRGSCLGYSRTSGAGVM